MDNTITQEGFPTLEDYQKENSNEQLQLFEIQEFAIKNTESLDQLQDKLKTASDMLKESYTNTSVYNEQEVKVKEAQKQLKVIKSQIESQPSVIGLKNQVKSIKSDIKDKRVMITDYALEIYRRSGSNEFEVNGQTFEIKTVAKLVKRQQ